MMKKTIVKIRGFDCDFELTLKRKSFMTLDAIEKFIFKEFTPTAIIKEIRYYTEEKK